MARATGGLLLDGELVVGDPDVPRTQDFAAAARLMRAGERAVTRPGRFVAFDLLAHDGRDLRSATWTARDRLLRAAVPDDPRSP